MPPRDHTTAPCWAPRDESHHAPTTLSFVLAFVLKLFPPLRSVHPARAAFSGTLRNESTSYRGDHARELVSPLHQGDDLLDPHAHSQVGRDLDRGSRLARVFRRWMWPKSSSKARAGPGSEKKAVGPGVFGELTVSQTRNNRPNLLCAERQGAGPLEG